MTKHKGLEINPRLATSGFLGDTQLYELDLVIPEGAPAGFDEIDSHWPISIDTGNGYYRYIDIFGHVADLSGLRVLRFEHSAGPGNTEMFSRSFGHRMVPVTINGNVNNYVMRRDSLLELLHKYFGRDVELIFVYRGEDYIMPAIIKSGRTT